MALGAITQVQADPHATVPATLGDLKVTVTNVVGDSSYPTGGSAVTAAQLGLTTVLFSQTEVAASSGTNCAATGSAYAGGKLVCFANTGVEVAATGNLSGITWQIISFGY